jgi:cytochrome P450
MDVSDARYLQSASRSAGPNEKGTDLMRQTLSSLQDVQEMYRWFEQMRATQPVWLDKSSGCWHVFRYDDVLRVATDSKVFSSQRPRAFARLNPRSALVTSLISMDPPQHRQYRNLVSPSFTSRALAPLTGRISKIAQELLDRVRPNGRMDVVADFTYPLPTTVIAEMLGVPSSDRPTFKRWADALFARQLSDAEIFNERELAKLEKSESFQRAYRASDEMYEYFGKQLEERRQHPRDDMISDLLVAEVEGERLNQEQVIGFCTLLLLAGHITTTLLLGQAIFYFDEHPEVMEQLRAQPELMTGAIEEVLRYGSPVWRLTRVTTEEVEVDGVAIPTGSVVFAWLASANHDETQFPDPERFDITRSPNRHVAFGHGIHFCLGAPLARLEASIALPMMLEQLPHLRRDRSAPMELINNRAFFGFKKLPVTFDAGSLE